VTLEANPPDGLPPSPPPRKSSGRKIPDLVRGFLKDTAHQRRWEVSIGAVWVLMAPVAFLFGAMGGSAGLFLVVPPAAIVFGIATIFRQRWGARGLQVMSWALAGFFAATALGILFAALNPFAETRLSLLIALPAALILGVAQGTPFALMALKLRAFDPSFRWLALVGVGLLAVAVFVAVDRHYSQTRWEDVSHQPGHARVLGETCAVLKGLRAHGVEGIDTRDITAYVRVTILPGFGGREVTFTRPLPKGTTFTITNVRRCTNCLFGTEVDYRIAVANAPDLAGYEVFTRSDTFAADEVACTANSPH
jgi:hypothetical protein